MPLLRAAMYGKGVQIYCAPTVDDRERWASTMRHIALEGRCFVLAACQYLEGEGGVPLIGGGSLIVNPQGEVLAGPAREGECLLTACLDLGQLAEGTFDFDPVGHYSRPDVFRLEVNEADARPVRYV
jgi:nitrilase